MTGEQIDGVNRIPTPVGRTLDRQLAFMRADLDDLRQRLARLERALIQHDCNPDRKDRT